MNRTIAYLKRQLKREEASATLIFVIFGVMFLCLMIGFALDIGNSTALKDSQTKEAQQAVERAVKQVDARGSLSSASSSAVPAAVTSVVKNYRAQTHGDASGGGRAVYQTDACARRTITRWDGSRGEEQLPYIVVRLDTGRAAQNTANEVTYVARAGEDPVQVAGKVNPALKYQVVQAEVHDSASSLMLGMVGIPCQNLTSEVSAVTFGSQSDVAGN